MLDAIHCTTGRVSSRSIALVTALALTLAAGPSGAQTAAIETPPTEIGVVTVHARTLIQMHFLAYHGENQYSVHVRDQHCNTPCTLVLPSGPTTIHAEGTGELTTQLVVPHLSAQVRLDHGAPGWYTPLGAVFIPAGVVVGGGLWALGLACGYGGGSTGCYIVNFVGWPVLGLSMLITGAVLLSRANRGSPADANRVEILDARARPRIRFTDLALAPTVSGLSGSIAFAF